VCWRVAHVLAAALPVAALGLLLATLDTVRAAVLGVLAIVVPMMCLWALSIAWPVAAGLCCTRHPVVYDAKLLTSAARLLLCCAQAAMTCMKCRRWAACQGKPCLFVTDKSLSAVSGHAARCTTA